MGILRRKKDESGKSLLGTSSPTATATKKRGLFGMRKADNKQQMRSDNPKLETKTGLSSAAHWGKVRPPKTPPLTPEFQAPVSNVTLVKGRSSAEGGQALQKAKRSNNSATPDDLRSEYSDLTDNRTLQRLNDQKAAYEQAMREKKVLNEEHSAAVSLDPADVLRQKTRRTHPLEPVVGATCTPSSPVRSTSPHKQPERSFFTDLLGLMDQACKPLDPTPHSPGSPSSAANSQVDGARSFTPEWGVAPTYDETDTRDTPSALVGARAHRSLLEGDTFADTVDDGGDTVTNGDTLTREDTEYTETERSQSQPSRGDQSSMQSSAPRSVHENFEMVLEELQEDEDATSPKKRNGGKPSWIKNPFGRGPKQSKPTTRATEYKESPKVTTPLRSNKAHQDMVKQALFPDYQGNGDDNNKDQPKTPARNNTRAMRQQGQQKSPAKAPQGPAKKPATTANKSPPTRQTRPQQGQKQRSIPNRPSHQEEKKEEEVADGIELPPPKLKKITDPPKKGGLFRSLRRRKSASKLATVKEDSQARLGARPSPPRNNKAAIAMRHENSRSTQDSEEIYRDLRADEPALERSYSDDSQDFEETEATRSSQTNNTSTADSGGQPPTRTAATAQDVDDPGFVGGFVAMLTEAVKPAAKPTEVHDEVKNIPEKQPRSIPQSQTWKEKDRQQDAPESKQQPSASSAADHFHRSVSAPQKVGNRSFKRRKPVWKEVKDANSGRSYYYHRLTRKTTWTRPAEMDTPIEEEEEDIQPEQVDANAQQPKADNNRPGQTTEEKPSQAALQQSAAAAQANSRKASARDFDPVVWKQKQEIVQLLEALAPPDGASVDMIMKEYEGRETELLAHLRRMKESRPFDEPLAADEEDEEMDEGEDAVTNLNSTLTTGHSSRSRGSFARTQSGITSRQSESTQQMANTRNRPRPRYEESLAGRTSLSSHGETFLKNPAHHHLHQQQQAEPATLQRIPSKIPAPRVRSRELMVEEFSQERGFRSETFNNDLRGPAQSNQTDAAALRRRPFTSPAYGPDTIQEEENDEISSHANDTVSALSVNEMEFVQPTAPAPGMDDARRRALDDAIRREDWDMAAAISDGMRTIRSKNPDTARPRQEPGEWRQSELDRFISENDWDAVNAYIAHLRTTSNAGAAMHKEVTRERAVSPASELTGPNLSFGAASQQKGKYSEMIANNQDHGGGVVRNDPTYEFSDEEEEEEDSYHIHNSNDRKSQQKKRPSLGKQEAEKPRSKHPQHASKILTSMTRSFSSDEESETSDAFSEDYSSGSSFSAPRRRRQRRGSSGKKSSRRQRSRSRRRKKEYR